jgi:hypothetical protein
MGKASDYRLLAEDCMRRAKAALNERDRLRWITRVQAWCRLADQVTPAGLGSGQAIPLVLRCRSRSGLRIRP